MTDQIKLLDGVTVQRSFVNQQGRRYLVVEVEVPNRAPLTLMLTQKQDAVTWINQCVRAALVEYAYQLVPYSPSKRDRTSTCQLAAWDGMRLADIQQEIAKMLAAVPNATFELMHDCDDVAMYLVGMRDETDEELAARHSSERVAQGEANKEATIRDRKYNQPKANQ